MNQASPPPVATHLPRPGQAPAPALEDEGDYVLGCDVLQEQVELPSPPRTLSGDVAITKDQAQLIRPIPSLAA